MKLQRLLSLLAVPVIVASTASATNIVIQAASNDREIWEDGNAKNSSHETIRLGVSAGLMTAGVFGFALPELQPNEIITNVTFSIGLVGRSNNPAGNIDLHGLGVRSSSAPILGDDFYNGQLPIDDTDAVMLVDDFLTASSPTGVINSTGNLAGYLNNFYSVGIPQDDFLILRLVMDAETLPNSRYYTVMSANYTVDEALRPYLTITTVPEPSTTAGLFGLAALGAALVRRRMKARKQ